jgi:hypothetical protein
MIEPTRIDKLGLTRDSLKVKPKAANYRKTPSVDGRGSTAHPMYAGPTKCKLQARGGGFGHISIAAGVFVQPVAELTGTM